MKKYICIALVLLSVIGASFNVLSAPLVNTQHAYIEGVSYTGLDGKETTRGKGLYIPILTYMGDKNFLHGALRDYATGILSFRKEAELHDNMLMQKTIDVYDQAAKIDEVFAERLSPVTDKKAYPLCAKDLLSQYKLSRDEVILTVSGMKKGDELLNFNEIDYAKKLSPRVDAYDIFILLCTVTIPATLIYIVCLAILAIKGKQDEK